MFRLSWLTLLNGLESFFPIQKHFLEQTCAHFLAQYPDCQSKSIHNSFVFALTTKYPALNFLDPSVDGKKGRAPHVSDSKIVEKQG